VAEQSLIYEDDLAYQPDGRLAVDANASRACDIPEKEPRPCGGWKNPASTELFIVQCARGEGSSPGGVEGSSRAMLATATGLLVSVSSEIHFVFSCRC